MFRRRLVHFAALVSLLTAPPLHASTNGNVSVPGNPCAEELSAYGFDLAAFAKRMEALVELARKVRSQDTSLEEVRDVLQLQLQHLARDLPDLQTVLHDHRSGAPNLAVANAIRAHNLKNQLNLLDIILPNALAAAVDSTDFAEFRQRTAVMLDSLGNTARFLSASARRSSTSVQRVPMVVTLLSDDVDMLLNALFPPTVRVYLNSTRPPRSSWITDADGMPRRRSPSTGWIGWQVRADEALLVEAFTNLMTNAAAAMSQHGGKRFSVKVGARFVLPDAPAPAGVFRPVPPAERGEHVVYTFTDTGGGMPTDRIAALWNGQSTKGNQGNGLGLPHVAWVVRAHDGFIEVASRRGEGTSIHVGLPLLQPSAPRTVTVTEPDKTEAPDILVIDDSTDSADMQAMFFSQLRKDRKTVPAYCTAEALNVIGGKRQIVFLDATIPGEDFRESILAIRKKNPRAIIAVLSGHKVDARPELEELRKLVDEWFVKPMPLSKLMAFVDDVYAAESP